MKVSRTSSHKKHTVVAGAVLLVVVAVLVWRFMPRGVQDAPAVVDQPSSQFGGDTGKQEEHAGKKETNPTDRPQTLSPAREGAKISVTPIITGFNRSEDRAQLMVDGGVNEIVEKGGICRFTVNWPGGGVSQQTEGVNAPSSTSCKTAHFPMDQLPPGVNVTIQVSYESLRYAGTSTNGPSITKEQIQ